MSTQDWLNATMYEAPLAQPALPDTRPTQPFIPQPNVPGATPTMTTEEWIARIQGNPLYKQEQQNVENWAQAQRDQAAFDAEWNTKFYEQNKQQIASSGSGSYSGDAEAAAILKLQKEKAAHDLANQQEYIRESLGSRGMGESGQAPLEQSEAKYAFDTFVKELDLREEARRGAAAAAASAAASSRSNALSDLELRRQYQLAQDARAAPLLEKEIAAKNGDALLKVAPYVQDMYFDAQGRYVGPGGEVLTPQQAQQSLPAPAAPPPPPAPYVPPEFQANPTYVNSYYEADSGRLQ